MSTSWELPNRRLFFYVFLFGRIEKRAKPPVYSRYAVIARKRLLMVV